MRSTLPLLAALFVVLSAHAQPRSTDVFVEGAPGALSAFHAGLRSGRARVYVYGASHTAPDVYTDELRRRLARRFGDGGPGWIVPAQPFPFYDHARAELSGRGWTGKKVRYREQRQDAYGLAGIALDTHTRAEARVRVRDGGCCDRVALHYQRQPGGGRIVLVAGEREQTIDTSAERRAPAVATLRLAEPVREVRLRAEGRVRIFGVTLERGARGVVVDAFGVPGARFQDQEPWDEATIRVQLEARTPDLVAFAYGTNESGQARVPLEDYREHLRRGLERWRRMAPEASCLLIGPGEWPRRRRNGSYARRQRTAQIIEIQKQEARRAGCAFFDTLAMMGGEGSMERWVSEGLALDDHVHFTDAGYRRMGAALHRALMEGFEP